MACVHASAGNTFPGGAGRARQAGLTSHSGLAAPPVELVVCCGSRILDRLKSDTCGKR